MEVIPQAELELLRDLAKRVREIAHDPLNLERQRLWRLHNELRPERPMVLAELGGVMNEVEVEISAVCQHELARGLERHLRIQIYNFETLRDDRVIPGWLDCNWRVGIGGYGVEVKRRRGDNDGKMGSYTWDPPIKKLPDDLDRLQFRECAVDREATLKHKAWLEEIFAGILPVRVRGGFFWTMGLTWPAIDLIGLEQLMLYMIDEPAGLHQLMGFLRDDHLAMTEWLEKEGLLTLNNEYDYIGSGSIGYTGELPQSDYPEGMPARRKDLWVLSESQETVGISPQMFAEFIFPYQLPIIEKFGLCYYGCCEPVETRWETLKTIPNLRKVSVSPWCDEEVMAAALQNNYNYCRKPNPTLISCPQWDEELILEDLRRTMRVAGHCNLEFAMKDVHTVANQPWRLARWVELARQAIAG